MLWSSGRTQSWNSTETLGNSTLLWLSICLPYFICEYYETKKCFCHHLIECQFWEEIINIKIFIFLISNCGFSCPPEGVALQLGALKDYLTLANFDSFAYLMETVPTFFFLSPPSRVVFQLLDFLLSLN